MNATELKIGDYVLFHNTIVQISSIDITYCCGVDIPKGIASTDRKTAHFDEIFPIPLTEEILVNNEWTKYIDREGFAYYKNYGQIKIKPIAEDDVRWMVWNGDSYLNTIRYVYELQHILWVIGLNDELNF